MVKVAVAMSGGLDSSMTAALLSEAKIDIIGITCHMGAGIPTGKFNPFPIDDGGNLSKIKAFAEQYAFPHYTLKVKEDFFSEVIEPFCMEYLRGRTPNPCILCNRKIKFKSILEFAKELGCTHIATGHYANIGFSNGRYYVSKAFDETKDQSYFLYRLPQDILRHVIFPLGKYKKSDIRRMAEERGLEVAEKPESQEICFIPDNKYADFIEKAMDINPIFGNIVSVDGKIAGRHRGIHRYTIGQRRGLGIATERPLYVISINAEDNSIFVGFKEELGTWGLIAGDIVYMKETKPDGLDVMIKTRSAQRPVRGRLYKAGDKLKALFEKPVQGISPGQAAVFYNGSGDILAGGTIEHAVKSR